MSDQLVPVVNGHAADLSTSAASRKSSDQPALATNGHEVNHPNAAADGQSEPGSDSVGPSPNNEANNEVSNLVPLDATKC